MQIDDEVRFWTWFSTFRVRTMVVPADWSLAFLHGVVQSVFGWLDYHQYEFSVPGDAQQRRWTEQIEDFDDIGMGMDLESFEMPMSQLLKKSAA